MLFNSLRKERLKGEYEQMESGPFLNKGVGEACKGEDAGETGGEWVTLNLEGIYTLGYLMLLGLQAVTSTHVM